MVALLGALLVVALAASLVDLMAAELVGQSGFSEADVKAVC